MLRDLRDQAGITQQQLADKSSLSVDSIRGFEAGRFNMRLETANKIAEALSFFLKEPSSLLLKKLADGVEKEAA